MKIHALTLNTLLLVSASALPLAASANDVLCDNKALEVRAQLEQAQAQNNTHRIEGLTRALASIENECTDERVLEDAREEVRESLNEVQQRQAEFEQAVSDGDEGDVRKRRLKLEEATLELEEDTDALNELIRQIAS